MKMIIEKEEERQSDQKFSQQISQDGTQNQENQQEVQDKCTKIVKAVKKKKLFKIVEFSYKYIHNILVSFNNVVLHTYGDIVIDLSKLNNDNRFSIWNSCKSWPKTEICKISNTLNIHLENKNDINDDQNKYLTQMLKQYPNQNIHNTIQLIEQYGEFSKILIQYFKNYFSLLKQNPILVNQFFQQRQQFDQFLEKYIFKEYNDQGLVYFASNMGPDIISNDLQIYKSIYSESLALILGKSLQELQDSSRRNGVYEFVEFEAYLEIVRYQMNSILDIFQKSQNNILSFNNFQSHLQFKQQLKIYTYDEIEFYTNASIKILKMSDYIKSNNQIIDFYCGVLVLDISPSTLKQIITLREKSKSNQKIDLEQEDQSINYVYNLEYAMQAEIFVDKYIKLNNSHQNNKNINDKSCNYKFILK